MQDGARAGPDELGPQQTGSHDLIQRLLAAVRAHLDLDVGFISQLIDGRRLIRFVDAASGCDVIAVGDSDAEEESYCAHVLAGRLPQLLLDPTDDPLSAGLRATSEIPVGTHLSVPIRFSDGRTFGTFCCFGVGVHRPLDERDLRTVRMVADVASEYLEAIDASEHAHRQRRALIRQVIDDAGAVEMVFQPLRELSTMDTVGLEALARFPGRDGGPEWFFAEAAKAGLGVELEMVAVRAAFAALAGVPAPIRINVNVSPETLVSDAFRAAIAGVPPDRVVVEVTEHAVIEDYTEMQVTSAQLSERGIWLSIDDVGMGFSGLHRILESAPEELKLDRVVVADVDTNPVKQALIEAFCSFGARAGFNVVAEGIETEAELVALRALGVTFGQGYHLGRPAPLRSALATDEDGR